MISLRRARLALLACLVGSFVLLVLWFPLGELMGQRSNLGVLSAELTSVEAKNQALKADVSALHSNAAIAALAHGQYGLVGRGQISYVILPAKGSSSGAAALDPRPIPVADLVAQDLAPAPSPPPTGTEPGFWSRFVDRLEFWRRPS